MAEFLAARTASARRLLSSGFASSRVVVIAAVALAGGAAAAGAVIALTGGTGGPASRSGGSQVPTAPVIRTDLINTVQVGGSLGYDGSYTITFPAGASSSQISQAQQTVTQDEQQLSAAERAESDQSTADDQAIAGDRANVSAAWSTLTADRARKKKDCAGSSASSAACSQDAQQVSQDRSAVAQAKQQLVSARSTARLDLDQNQATVVADRTKLRGDQASLASMSATATNPGSTYTWLPEPGQVIRQDQRVYSVSDEPVPLLYGPVVAYRAFYIGMSDGADVGELTRDLIALGYGDGLVSSDHYSPGTAAAVQRWQTAHGLPPTGQILLGAVLFEPGPIRVTSVTPSVGTSAGGGAGGGGGGGSAGGGGGTVLTATGTTAIVAIDLDVSQEYLVKPGNPVSVVLPDGTSTVRGRVQAVGTVATCPGGAAAGTGNGTGAGSGGQSPCSSAGNSSTPTVPVTITLDHAPPGRPLDQAPVNVNITTQRADNVLAVPVNALLALQGGGYAVQVVTGGTSHLVGVTTGLYSSTMVQISGSGVRAGERVAVPSS